MPRAPMAQRPPALAKRITGADITNSHAKSEAPRTNARPVAAPGVSSGRRRRIQNPTRLSVKASNASVRMSFDLALSLRSQGVIHGCEQGLKQFCQ